MNVSNLVGTIVSTRLATLHELDTVYGIEDLYDMIEILAVSHANEAHANKSD